ncbi:CaiB/BaiF CoA transferase family protein [Chloroflexota bacterium]
MATVGKREEKDRMLGRYRAIDLTDEKGHLAGAILSQLGADVIKVESPEGDEARTRKPLVDTPGYGKVSLQWLAYNNSKRDITLNLEKEEGRQILRRLVAKAHFLVESYPPGFLDKLGLGYADLKKINPGLIMASITPFGQSGPRCQDEASDITLMAMGGLMVVTGESDRPPVRVFGEQSYLLASLSAVAAMTIAHHYRSVAGKGQHIDISICECLTSLLTRDIAKWDLQRTMQSRLGSRMQRDKVSTRVLWRCADGYVVWQMWGGKIGAKENRSLTLWLKEHGLGEDMENVLWEKLDMSRDIQDKIDRWEEDIGKLFGQYHGKELEVEALKRGVALCRVYGITEVAESEHLASRGFWSELYQTEFGAKLRYPGYFFKSSEADAGIKSGAPMVGEHNEEIYVGELGLAPSEIEALKRSSVI